MNESLFSLNGRLQRKVYFLRTFPVILAITFATMGNSNSSGIALLTILSAIFIIIQTTKRLHDLGHSGWYILYALIPIVNIVFSGYVHFAPGTIGANQYGTDPREESKAVVKN